MWQSRLTRQRTKHRVDRRGRDPEPAADLDRAQAPCANAARRICRTTCRWVRFGHGARPTGPVDHPGRTLGSEPGRPLAGGHGRDHEHLRRRRRRPAVLDDQFREPQSSSRGQCSVSVGHEGLLVAEAVPRQLHFTTGGLHLPATQGRVTKQRPWTSHLAQVRRRVRTGQIRATRPAWAAAMRATNPAPGPSLARSGPRSNTTSSRDPGARRPASYRRAATAGTARTKPEANSARKTQALE